MTKYLFFKPYFETKIWGGSNLKTIFNLDDRPWGEAWIISAIPNKESICISSGFENQPLSVILKNHPQLFNNYTNQYPNLLKFIDTAAPLSLQVHPDDDYAWKTAKSYGKNELWYVLANDGSPFVIDYQPDTLKQTIQHLKNHNFNAVINHMVLKPHDYIYIPAGTIHAIPKNTTVFEIQQSSDLTYRIYDYDRVDENNKLRDLHLTDALNVLKDKKELAKLRVKPQDFLIANQYFNLKKYEIKSTTLQTFNASEYNPDWTEMVVVEGEGLLDKTIPIKKGDAWIMTHNQDQTFIFSGTMIVLVNYVKVNKI